MNIPDHISKSFETIFWVKNTGLKFFDADLDPGSGMEKFGSQIRNTAFFHYGSIFFGSRQGPVTRPQASFRTPGMRQQWRQLRRPQFTSCHRRRRRSHHRRRFGVMSRRLAGPKLLWEQLQLQHQQQQQQLAASPPTAASAV
jgi:hypothetical protein